MTDHAIRSLHPILARINKVIHDRHISIRSLEPAMGGAWTHLAVGSWLRGDRHPTLDGVETLANALDLEIGVYPKGTDVDSLLARVAELEAENARLARYVAAHAVEVEEPSVQGRGWAVVERVAA